MHPSGEFLVVLCQPGAERALKAELAREHPALRPAFARPGLVTFKDKDGSAGLGPAFALRSVLSRSHALAVGSLASISEILDAARAIQAQRKPHQPLRLHVWPRDLGRPGEVDPSDQSAADALALSVDKSLREAGGALFAEGVLAAPREAVLDVIVAAGEPHFVGWHLHEKGRSPHPGGALPVLVPPEAPSRAYRKIEEAIAWSGAPLHEGQTAVEIGSAPGGASYALLRRGLRVVGVDPGAMADVVLLHPRFSHLQVAVGELDRAQLPERADWLLLDVNLAPQVALHAVRGVVSALRPSLRGLLFTLKLNDWAMAARIPDLLRRVEAMGAREVRATQLPSNRQEIFCYGVLPARR